MFSEVIETLRNDGKPEPGLLRKRFDFAMTKKLGALHLPPACRISDPKILPRSDHLFWAALLLKDRQRIDMALSVLGAELSETVSLDESKRWEMTRLRARELFQELLEQFPDTVERKRFEAELQNLMPQWLAARR